MTTFLVPKGTFLHVLCVMVDILIWDCCTVFLIEVGLGDNYSKFYCGTFGFYLDILKSPQKHFIDIRTKRQNQ